MKSQLTVSIPAYRVTDEALTAETMVWPNFFLIKVFFALKGSKLFIIIRLSKQVKRIQLRFTLTIMTTTIGYNHT